MSHSGVLVRVEHIHVVRVINNMILDAAKLKVERIIQ